MVDVHISTDYVLVTEVYIRNKHLASIEANRGTRYQCPNCMHTQIEKAWNYQHKYCPHCGAKIIWDLKE